MKRLLGYSFSYSLLRNFTIQAIWWVIFFPGFFSGDSFGAVNIAKTGEMTNAYTASWAIYVRLFSFHGQAIALLTLINGFLLVYSVTRLGYSLFSNRTAAISTFLLTLTPVVSGMGVTLWHDILMSAGIVLVTAFFINYQRDPKNVKSIIFKDLIPGAILTSFRPNGLPTLLFFAFLYIGYLLIRKSSLTGESTKLIFATLALSCAVTFIGSNVIIGMSPINNYYAQEWMRNDISCYAATATGAGFVEKRIPGVGSTETWKSSDACAFLNRATVTVEEKTQAKKYVSSAWLHLLVTDPIFIIKTHLDRNAYLVPFPISGIPTEPFLHSAIEYKDQGINWAFPSIAEKARVIMRIWNAARGLTGWAGFWALVLILVALFRKDKYLVPAIFMSLALIGILFVVAPIPDGRYALFVLIAGQRALIGNLVEWAQTGSNRRPTD